MYHFNDGGSGKASVSKKICVSLDSTHVGVHLYTYQTKRTCLVTNTGNDYSTKILIENKLP